MIRFLLLRSFFRLLLTRNILLYIFRYNIITKSILEMVFLLAVFQIQSRGWIKTYVLITNYFMINSMIFIFISLLLEKFYKKNSYQIYISLYLMVFPQWIPHIGFFWNLTFLHQFLLQIIRQYSWFSSVIVFVKNICIHYIVVLNLLFYVI